MARVLVLGAGMVAAPLVEFLSARGHQVTVADREPGALAAFSALAAETVPLDVGDLAALSALVRRAELVVSMLPFSLHPAVAKICVEEGRGLVTTSYVSAAMQALHEKAVERGVVLLNELGLDPGLDHASAVLLLSRIRADGGKILGFRSFCGGLPAPEDADNPWKYKFSWSPRGVLIALRNSARWLEDGGVREASGPALFAACRRYSLPGVGDFEGYSNRDSLVYRGHYGLDDATTIQRGTLRYAPWCSIAAELHRNACLEDAARTAGSFAELFFPSGRLPAEMPVEAAAAFEYAGMLSPQPLPPGVGSRLDALEHLLRQRLMFKAGERDLVVMIHEVEAALPEVGRRIFRSVLVQRGEPGGHSAMARTVSCPAAVAADWLLSGGRLPAGVSIPVSPALAAVIMKGVEGCGIVFQETEE